jgi:hypothetical protein
VPFQAGLDSGDELFADLFWLLGQIGTGWAALASNQTTPALKKIFAENSYSDVCAHSLKVSDVLRIESTIANTSLLDEFKPVPSG